MIGQLTRRLRSARGGLSHSLLSTLVSAPSITRLVAELESKLLVSRTPDPADGRASLIQVTDAGLEAVQVARRVRQQMVAELLEPLSADEVASIEAALPALERLIEPR